MSVASRNELPRRGSKKYNRAPITEAVIEIRVMPAEGFAASSCKSVFSSVRDEFPQLKELKLMHAQISGGQTVGASATQRLAGYNFQNPSRGQILTACPERFSFSQLAPYDRWETFCPAALRFWELFRKETRPTKVTRIATRFINRIEIPMPISDIADFFKTAPIISPDIPQSLSTYFMQLELPQNDLMCMATLSQALLSSEDGSLAPFILDIDIFDERGTLQTEESISARLEELRWRKNEIFEACITDRVRELIS